MGEVPNSKANGRAEKEEDMKNVTKALLAVLALAGAATAISAPASAAGVYFGYGNGPAYGGYYSSGPGYDPYYDPYYGGHAHPISGRPSPHPYSSGFFSPP